MVNVLQVKHMFIVLYNDRIVIKTTSLMYAMIMSEVLRDGR